MGFLYQKELENETEIFIHYQFVPGEIGTSDKYGAKYEPDWPDMIEILEIEDLMGNVIEIGRAELEKLEEEILINYYKNANSY